MQVHLIKAKRTFTLNGEEKTQWLEVGAIRIADSGQWFVQLNQNPNETYRAFPLEKKAPEQKVIEEPVQSDGIELSEIPF